MASDRVRVRAEVRLLTTSESGRSAPVRGSYRPNHNFFDADNREMAMGFIDLPSGAELHPGETMEVPITFSTWPRLAGEIYPGREWRIQEGGLLVGVGKVLKVLDGTP